MKKTLLALATTLALSTPALAQWESAFGVAVPPQFDPAPAIRNTIAAGQIARASQAYYWETGYAGLNNPYNNVAVYNGWGLAPPYANSGGVVVPINTGRCGGFPTVPGIPYGGWVQPLGPCGGAWGGGPIAGPVWVPAGGYGGINIGAGVGQTIYGRNRVTQWGVGVNVGVGGFGW
jgi:hypothetical protein